MRNTYIKLDNDINYKPVTFSQKRQTNIRREIKWIVKTITNRMPVRKCFIDRGGTGCSPTPLKVVRKGFQILTA